MLEMIKKHIADLAASNWDDYKAAFAANVVYEEKATRLHVEGADEYLKAVQRWKRAFPDLNAKIKDSVISGDTASVELEWEGTHSGPLEAPFGNVPATNRQGKLPAVLILKFENNKIVEAHHYFDLFTLMTQLGLAPAMGAPPPEAKPAAEPKRV
jgi:steroid delta-isomerase-like uncharacterized protein